MAHDLSHGSILGAVLAPAPPPPSPALPVVDASPAIHVHIGRIEIKSAPPRREATEAPRTGRKPPPLTLEEYLKRRGGSRS